MREFNEREKEIIRLIVAYDFEDFNTFTKFLQKKYFTKESGKALLISTQCNLFLFSPSMYPDRSSVKQVRYFIELCFLISYLFDNRYLSKINAAGKALLFMSSRADDTFRSENNRIIINQENEYFTGNTLYSEKGDIIYSSVNINILPFDICELLNVGVFVSQDLKDLVKNNFETPEQIRFEKQLKEAKRQTCGAYIATGVSFLGLLIAMALPFLTKTSLKEIEDIKLEIRNVKTELPAVIETRITNDTIKVQVVKPMPIKRNSNDTTKQNTTL